jgi:hypothetical protein
MTPRRWRAPVAKIQRFEPPHRSPSYFYKARAPLCDAPQAIEILRGRPSSRPIFRATESGAVTP